MRIIRLLLLIVLSLALPTVGLASAGYMGEFQMQQAADASMTEMAMPVGHCDETATKVAQPGKLKAGTLCKLGQDCKIGAAYHPTSPVKLFHPLPAAQRVTPVPTRALLSHVPEGLWRTPTSL